MSGGDSKRSARRSEYFERLVKLVDEYPKIFIVGCDNVGSRQMAKVRHALRGKAELLMGKNTMIRKALRGHLENNKDLEPLLPLIRGNIGFVFAKDDIHEVKKKLVELRVAAPAKAGNFAPVDVIVPAGPTGMEPTMTSFLQALNIPSKITRGQVEIVSDVHLIKAGQKVGASEANLLGKLDIKPFHYGLIIRSVYDAGSIYDASILDLTDDVILEKFSAGVKNVAAVSLALHYPTVASVPHSIVNGYKRVLAIGLTTEYTFPKAEEFKKAAAAGPAPTQAKGGAPAPAAKKEEKKVVEEPAEEEDGDLGMSLFD